MTKHNFLALFISFTVVTVLAVISAVKLDYESKSLGDSASVLAMPHLNTEQVRSIEISWLEQKSTLKFTDNHWCVTERGNAQALTSQVAELLEGLAKTSPLKELQIDGKLLEDLNLSETPDENNRKTGILIVLRDAADKEIFRIMLGRGHEKLSQERIGNYAVQGYDGRYARVWDPDGKQHIYLISHVFEKCSPNPRTWLEPLYLAKPESPLYIRFLKKDAEDEFKPVWMVAAGSSGYQLMLPVGEKLSVQELSRKVSILAAPFSHDLADDVEGLVFDSAIQLVMTDGFSYMIELAQKDEVLYAKMTVELAMDRVKQSKTETIDEFERRKRYSLSRFDYEKRTANGHVFVVRTDLLEQFTTPPVEPAAAAKTTATNAAKQTATNAAKQTATTAAKAQTPANSSSNP